MNDNQHSSMNAKDPSGEHARKPLVIDLFCGLGGFSEGFLAEGYDCIGFDVERHDYGSGGYPGQLVLQACREASAHKTSTEIAELRQPGECPHLCCSECMVEGGDWSMCAKCAREDKP